MRLREGGGVRGGRLVLKSRRDGGGGGVGGGGRGTGSAVQG